MKLHENSTLYQDAIRFTAQQLNLKPEYIEKDYWVTYVLYVIFNSEVGTETIFKGGTALSKCYNLIERFSEDIDLVVLRHEGDTDTKLKNKLKAINRVVEQTLQEVQIEGITHKVGTIRKAAYSYNKSFEGNYGQVRDIIVVESTWLGHYEPHTTKSIISFVGQMMLNNGQSEIATANGLLPFELQSLEPTRTICEKIMSLVRFSYGKRPIDDLKNKIRHTYDLHQLLREKEFLEFFRSTAFDEMLLKVANDDVKSFRNNNQWLEYHPKEAIIFKNLEKVWSELKSTYNDDFKSLVYGKLPTENSVFETLKLIQTRLENISWVINIDEEPKD